MVDFTSCKQIRNRAYNGANGKKIAVVYHGEIYMLKFPPSGESKRTDLSYTNSCISEHIASSVFNMLGIEAQETMLGTFRVGEKEKVVCACKDFTADGGRLFDFCSIKNTIIDSETNGTGTELSEVLETIEKQQFVDPGMLTEHFWNMFVADALLGNFDRHNGNWGFLYDEKRDHARIAPVFDCGSCLLPQADEGVMRKVLTDRDEMNARIFTFPVSALRNGGRKINYYDFLTSDKDPNCREAMKRIAPRIDLRRIEAFIDGLPYISGLQKLFYKTYINERHRQIIRPALEVALGDQPTQRMDDPKMKM